MTAIPDHRLSAAAFLDALADFAQARQSRAGAFIHVHSDLISACLREGYGAAPIYRGLSALGFPPPMSERQFHRYVQQLKGHLAAVTDGHPLGRQRRAIERVLRHAPGAGSPTVAPSPSGTQPPRVQPTTFDWDPTADSNDIR